jgi:hypothetical protein
VVPHRRRAIRSRLIGTGWPYAWGRVPPALQRDELRRDLRQVRCRGLYQQHIDHDYDHYQAAHHLKSAAR